MYYLWLEKHFLINEKIKQKVVDLLKKKRKLAVAESCTGGMLSSSITSLNGSSKVFNIGLVTYSNKSKNLFKNSKKIIKKHGAVSSQCCSYMVNNLSKNCKSNIAVSITGIAGPKGRD